MKYTKGILLVLTTSIISGFSVFLNKWGASGIEPYFFTFAKNLLVAVLLTTTLFLVYKFKEFKDLKYKDWWNLILIGFVGGSVPFLLFFKGLTLTSAAQASFFHKTMFIWLVPISWLFLKKRINKYELIAASVMLLGSIFYFQYKPETLNYGDLLILIAAIMWAFEIALAKKILSHLSGFMVAWGRMFFGAILIFFFLLFKNNGFHFTLDYSVWQYIWIAISAVILFAYVATFYNGLKYIPAFTAAAIMALGAPLTSLLSLVFINEKVIPLKITGIILLILGLYLVVFQKKLWPQKMILSKN